jgi:hypothetical protein
MRLLMGNLIFLYRESRDYEMGSGVVSREIMIWNPESGIGSQKALNARSISSS